jgi:AcrR family transcriptional regulator
MGTGGSQTREDIIAAADELFYRGSLREVSVDDIAAKAGVTKKTIYYHFRSKDDLIAAYLAARDRPTLERCRSWAGVDGSLKERMARMFHALARASRSKHWRGCGFIRAAAELADLPGHPAMSIARAHKSGVEKWLVGCLIEEGYSDAEELAKSLMILLDGAVTRLIVHRDAEYARVAARTAQTLLGSAVRQRMRRRGTPIQHELEPVK